MKPIQEAVVSKTAVTRSMRVRAGVVVGFFVLCFVAVICSLVRYQIVEGEKYKTMAAEQQLSDKAIVPHRGTIYDANMKVLAKSKTVFTVVVSPNEMKKRGTNVNMVATKLSELLEMSVEDLMEKLLNTDSEYQILKKKVDKPVVDSIKQWVNDYNTTLAEQNKKNDTELPGIVGISFEEDSKRSYPYGNFASTVIGFSGSDGNGLAGIELKYDKTLTGTPGRVVTAKNAWGYEMDSDYEARYDAVDGNSLVLTIDESIQHTLEKYLGNAVKEYNVAQRGVGIVMDVNTGAVLAMATLPDYNLNEPFTLYDTALAEQIAAIADEAERSTALQTARQKMWRNVAVQDIYEPGSVFKTVTASAALDSGKVGLDQTFSCSGSYQVIPSVTMRCAHAEGHGTLDFYNGLNKSCNPYYIQLGMKIGAETFCDYVRAFGFYEKTGIDMQNEAQSNIIPLERMKIVELASSSFGQSSQVTPISMITAMSAIVNGGYLLQPYVVQQVLDADGNIVSTTEPRVKRQVISTETSDIMRQMMEESVATGQNKASYAMGYRVGGKSGTSQKQNVKKQNESDPDLYYSSFCGFAPANDPKIAVLIVLDEPHDTLGYNAYGGRLCGPVVSNVISEVLPYLGVNPQYTDAELEKVDVTVPNVSDTSVNDAGMKLNAVGLNSKVVGSGDTVTLQYPAGGTVPRGSTVVLYTDPGAEGAMVVVPDLTTRSVQTAGELLKAKGLNMKATGAVDTAAGIQAVQQSIPPDTEVPMGTLIEVMFHDITITD